MKKNLLIVDDEKNIVSLLEEAFKTHFNIYKAYEGGNALDIIKSQDIDIVLLDVNLPDKSGIQVLAEIRNLSSMTQVIIITSNSNIEGAVEAIKLGAYNYVAKPFKINELRIYVQKALEEIDLKREVDYYRKRIKGLYGLDKIIGNSAEIMKVKENIKLVSPSDTTVLILGETGTGKQLVARAIHHLSNRKQKPFVDVNCSAIPSELIESELFGHRKGSFTGAIDDKTGYFEQADGGTLFLDEIADLSLNAQTKILKALEEKTIRRIGGEKGIDVDVRIIAATHKDLMKLIREGKFRQDLYFRINIFPIHIPPLRSRKKDIKPLINHFSKQLWSKPEINNEIISEFETYDWPGNIRELKNVMERLKIFFPEGNIPVDSVKSILRKDTIDNTEEMNESSLRKELARSILARGEGIDFSIEHDLYDKEILLILLDRYHHNISKIANLLNMSRNGLYKMMKRLDIRVDNL